MITLKRLLKDNFIMAKQLDKTFGFDAKQL